MFTMNGQAGKLPLTGHHKYSILKWAKFFGGILAKLSLPLFHIQRGKEAFLSKRIPKAGPWVDGLLGKSCQSILSAMFIKKAF